MIEGFLHRLFFQHDPVWAACCNTRRHCRPCGRHPAFSRSGVSAWFEFWHLPERWEERT